MVRSMFSGVSGLRAHQQKMDVIGNNIANVNTNGYKSTRTLFKESIYQTVVNSSEGSDSDKEGYGGGNASQVGYGSQVSSIDRSFETGNYSPTNFATDCMIDGNGFFMVGPKGLDAELDGNPGLPISLDTTKENLEKTSEALKRLNLTRVGDFKFDGDGYLVDSNKNVVYGYGYSDDNVEILDRYVTIQIPRHDPETAPGVIKTDKALPQMELENITIDDKGNVTGIESISKKVVKIGQLAVVNVPNPAALEKKQGPYFKAINNTGLLSANKAGTGGTGLIMSNGLEMANVDLAQEFSDMITAQRGFQANSRIITVTDSMLEELVNIVR